MTGCKILLKELLRNILEICCILDLIVSPQLKMYLLTPILLLCLLSNSSAGQTTVCHSIGSPQHEKSIKLISSNLINTEDDSAKENLKGDKGEKGLKVIIGRIGKKGEKGDQGENASLNETLADEIRTKIRG